ncbi:MAG: PAS domain S-box protein [Rhodospirillaceae bacterium]|nr:PAS domain S-box protein [Rhodospirillales bacterium]
MAWTWSSLRIWAAAALLAAAGSTASTWQIMTSHDAHLLAAEKLALSLSNAAAQRIAGSLRSMDVMLADAAEKVDDPAKSDPVVTANLRAKLDAFPELESMGLVDAKGWLQQIIHRDGPPRPLPADISNRPHVRYPQEHWRDNQLYISPPVKERFTGNTVLLLSRPIIGPDKTFRGSAGMAVLTAFMDDALASVVPGEGDAAGAFTPDGVLYSRHPRDERFIGKSIAESPLYRAYAATGGAGTAFYAPSFSDGADRIIGFAPVPHYPVVAAVGISRATVMDRWRRELWVHGSIQSVFVGVIFALALRLSRSERRRHSVTEQLLATERTHVETLSQAVHDRTAELHDSLAALTESEERFRCIVEISPLPLVLTRRSNSRVVYINAQAAETFAVPLEHAVDKIAPDYWDSPADRQAMIAALAADGQVRNFEVVLKRATGERFTALLSAANVTLRGEELVLVAVFDITERKRLEEDLGRSNRDLEQFSYAVSHDLQEPLRMVSSYLALLERRYAAKLDGDAHEFIGFAVDGAQRMSRMITDLLDYSRVHRCGNRFAPVALDGVLADAMANLSTNIADCAAEVTAAPLPIVWGDASQLMRVFQNLIGNALKYRTPETAPHIAITAEQSGGEWIVSVTDNGIGIDPTHAERLFQIFQRLHTRGVYEGSGVGLALCRRIMERHHGRIWMESAGDGRGSTFRVALPVAAPVVAESEMVQA